MNLFTHNPIIPKCNSKIQGFEEKNSGASIYKHSQIRGVRHKDFEGWTILRLQAYFP